MTATSFTLPGKLYYVFIAVLIVGTLGCLALLCAAFILVARLAVIAIGAISEAGAAFTSLYTSCDSLGRLIIWLVCLLLLFKTLPVVRASVMRTLTKLGGDLWTR